MNALVNHETRALSAAHSFADMERMAQVLAQSGLFGVKNPTQALALMLVAQAEGEHPASVAQDYDIIQGKGSRKTHSVLARFQAMGGKVDWHELSHTRAEATFSHPKGGSLKLDWTIEQAKNAGLVGKDNWKGYARAMLRARLIAEGVRAVYPAAIGGWQVPEEAMGPQLGDNETSAAPAPVKHMGAVEEVGAPAPPALPEFTEAHLQERTAKIHEFYSKGKTADEIIAFYALKATLPDAMQQRIREMAPKATDAVIKVTFAQVDEKLRAATTQDQLNEAAVLIDAVPDPEQRKQLSATYDELLPNLA